MRYNRGSAREILRLALYPALLICLGVLLLVNPDSASALLGKVLGWVLFAIGIGMVVSAWKLPGSKVFALLPAAAMVLFGMWMISHPLLLAVNLGRLAGVLLLIRGVQYLSQYHAAPKATPTIIIGCVLLLMPLTASRLLVSGCGLVVAAVGVIMLLDRLGKGPKNPDKPDIIDAL